MRAKVSGHESDEDYIMKIDKGGAFVRPLTLSATLPLSRGEYGCPPTRFVKRGDSIRRGGCGAVHHVGTMKLKRSSGGADMLMAV